MTNGSPDGGCDLLACEQSEGHPVLRHRAPALCSLTALPVLS